MNRFDECECCNLLGGCLTCETYKIKRGIFEIEETIKELKTKKDKGKFFLNRKYYKLILLSIDFENIPWAIVDSVPEDGIAMWENRKGGLVMKYKVGDKVKVREDLKSGKIYGGMSCNPDMEELKGQIVTIVDFCAIKCGYEINKDNKMYVWTDEMFEDLVKSAEDKKYIIHIRFVNGGNINLFNATQKQTEEFMEGMENCSRFMVYVDEDQKIFINAHNVTHYKIECLK